MSELQKLLAELHTHFAAYLQQDKPRTCENLKQMSICFDQSETKFNTPYRAMQKEVYPELHHFAEGHLPTTPKPTVFSHAN
jgi:hypothetical protein